VLILVGQLRWVRRRRGGRDVRSHDGNDHVYDDHGHNDDSVDHRYDDGHNDDSVDHRNDDGHDHDSVDHRYDDGHDDDGQRGR
jgi:hypothetical protein